MIKDKNTRNDKNKLETNQASKRNIPFGQRGKQGRKRRNKIKKNSYTCQDHQHHLGRA